MKKYHFILRLIDEYRDYDEDDYYLDMGEKQCKEKNVMNKACFLYNYSDDSDHSLYVDSDNSDDETDNDSVAGSVDEDEDDEDDVDVCKLGVDFVEFKESQNISIL